MSALVTITKKVPPEVLIAAGVCGVLLAWWAFRGVQGMARDLTSGAINATAGVVEGVGLAVGVPLTSQTQCEIDLAAGDYWAASFSCPAGKFAGGLLR